MKKSVLVYGVGKLGESILRGLIDRNISVYHESYNGPNDNEYVLDHKNVIVDIVNSTKLKNNFYKNDLQDVVSYIVVTLVGDVLEKEIDFLLSLNIPLVILSTKFNEDIIKQKALDANVKILMSQNMALGIVDFWDRISKINKVPDTLSEIYAFVLESHQSLKADISGSAIKALNLFEDKGFLVFFDDEDKRSFVKGVDGEYGCITCIREKKTQLEDIGVPEEFIDGHGYHTFNIFPESWNDESTLYINSLYNVFKSLEDYSIENVLHFEVLVDIDNGLVIKHNINGRDIYTDGVVKSIEFLETKQAGVYSAIDVINQFVE